MRLFIISSIEDISSRFGFEANQMLRAFAVVSRRALKAILRLTQSRFGHGAWQRVAGGPATSMVEQLRAMIQVITTPTAPVATLGAIAGNYSLNVPASLDTAMPGDASANVKPVGTGPSQRDCQVGQRDI